MGANARLAFAGLSSSADARMVNDPRCSLLPLQLLSRAGEHPVRREDRGKQGSAERQHWSMNG